MTDYPSRVAVEILPPDGLLALEVWGEAQAVAARFVEIFDAALPHAGETAETASGRVLWWEPHVWLFRAPLAARNEIAARLEIAAGADGAVTDVSGSFTRIGLTGPGWRELLMVGGLFDAESPDFGPGRIVGTVIDHAPLRLDVVGPQAVQAYLPPSYAAHMLHFWGAAAGRLSVLASD